MHGGANDRQESGGFRGELEFVGQEDKGGLEDMKEKSACAKFFSTTVGTGDYCTYVWKSPPAMNISEISKILTNLRKRLLREGHPPSSVNFYINSVRQELQLRARGRK